MLKSVIKSGILLISLMLLLHSCKLTSDLQPYLENSFTGQPSPSALHFDLVGNMIILKVQVGEEDTAYNFLFDTGAFTIIDKELAGDLGIQEEKRAFIGGAGGGIGIAGLTRIPKLTLGSTTVHNIGIGIIDLSPIGKVLGMPLHGIIGNNFFQHFTITWNYLDETFRIDTIRDILCDGLVFNFFQDLKTSNAPAISAVIDENHLFDFIFDTGFDGMISLPQRIITQLQYDSTRLLKAAGVISGGLFGNSPADWLIKPGQLRMGPLSLEDVVCTSNHLSVGLIGSELLRMAETTIQYPEKRLIIRPMENFTLNQSYFGTGMAATKTDDGYFTITGLWPGSPAWIAGFSPGDKITEVNGMDVIPKHAMWFSYLNRDKEVIPLTLKIRKHNTTEEIEYRIEKDYLLKNVEKEK